MSYRKISFLLAVILTANITASCGSSDTPVDTGAAIDTEVVITADPAADSLPADLNVNNEAVTFRYRQDIAGEFFVEEQTGDIVNDAIFNSHVSVEDRLGVNIEVVLRPGQTGNDRNTYMAHITSTVMAGDDVYDWVDLMIGNSPVKMQEGIFQNLLNNQYIDVTKPYYLGGLADLVTVDGKLYFISGDASLGYLKDTHCIFFNKAIAEDYKLDNIHEIVADGAWTLDKLMEIAQQAAVDLNNDGKYDDNDQLGFRMYDQNHFNGFYAAAELHMFTQEDGEWKFTFGSDRDSSVIEKINKLLYETPGCTLMHDQGLKPFVDGNVLFTAAEFDDAVSWLRDMSDPYSILPFPKYEASQKEYYSNARSTHNAFSMTTTSSNPDAAGAVMEALSASNYKNVTPAYFEIALKTKYSLDDESSRTFDIIRSGLTLDFGYIFSNIAKNPTSEIFINSIKAGNFASILAERKEGVINAFDTYMKAIHENVE